MSIQDKAPIANLMPSGRRDLAPVPSASPLVSRGVADLGRLLKSSAPISIDSDNALFYYKRGKDSLDEQDYDQAIKDFDEAIRCGKIKNTYHWRGVAWAHKEDYDKAIEDFDEAIRLDPNRAALYCDRGVVWSYKQNYCKALKDYEQAMRLDPTFASSYVQVAWLLATCPEHKLRDGKRAIQMAAKACELSQWERGDGLEALAAAYAEAGQFEEAVQYQLKASEDSAWPVADGFRQRLEFYRQERPFRDTGIAGLPSRVEINIPGELSVRLLTGWAWASVVLARTPGIVEIGPRTLGEANGRILAKMKQRFEKLRDLNAPEVILQNEIRIINKCEEALKNAGCGLEDHAYHFRVAAGYSVTAEELLHLSRLGGWEELDLSGCSITDDELKAVGRFMGLRILRLADAVEITDEGLAHLAALTQLEELHLSGCSVTDRGLAHLYGLKELQELSLSGCDKITQAGVLALKGALPECEVIEQKCDLLD